MANQGLQCQPDGVASDYESGIGQVEVSDGLAVRIYQGLASEYQYITLHCYKYNYIKMTLNSQIFIIIILGNWNMYITLSKCDFD